MKYDYVVVGAGIIGLTLSRALLDRDPDCKILILDKEDDVGAHGSGRNSGVLHAGFYYSANSLKARFTREGNIRMTQYCKENGLQINECGKVVVARDANELETLLELKKRGDVNGVELRLVNEEELEQIEPNARTYQQALFSPRTSTVDPLEICVKLKQDLEAQGVSFRFSDGYHGNGFDQSILTESGQKIHYTKKLINCAGLYADRIAADFGFSENYTIIPFKGIYLKYTGSDMPIKMNIYPVPDLKNPFLGVHYTVTVDNHIKIGPTAIPAFWRENYSKLSNFKLKELVEILFWEAKLFLLNSFNFRSLAFTEMRKYYKKFFVDLASSLVKKMPPRGFDQWTRPGIRAQLLEKKTHKLVQDFVVEGDATSVHVLNAVSPAFTSSFPFTEWVVKNYC